MALPTTVRRLVTHPAVRFLSLGGLLFLLHALRSDREEQRIRLTEAPREALFESFALEHGRPPDAQERAAVVRDWAEEQAVLQHAYALRLHETDTVVRRRLMQDVGFLLEAEAEPVTEVQVRARYLRDAERFRLPERRSFDHVFVGGRGAAARAEAVRLRGALIAGEEPGRLGDPSTLGARLVGLTQQRLGERLAAPLAAAAFELERDTWSEPLASTLGLHLLRVTDIQPGRQRELEEVRGELLEELAAEAREEALRRGRRALLERYVEGGPW